MTKVGAGLRTVGGLAAACLLLALWLGLGAAPAAAQTSCAGTISPPAGTLCGLALPAPAGTPTRRWRRPAKPKDVAPVPVLRRVVTADYDIPAKLQAIDEAIALLAGC